MRFKFEDKDYVLDKPAFLVGNGVNKYCPRGKTQVDLSWAKLLCKLLPKEFIHNESPELNGLTYPEMAELASIKIEESLANKHEVPEEEKTIYGKIYKEIVSYEAQIEKIDGYYGQRLLSEFSTKLNAPILTTNYDHTLLWYNREMRSKGRAEDLIWIDAAGNTYKNSKQGPKRTLLNAFYSNKIGYGTTLTDIRSIPGLWFIHGSKRYKSSFCITNDDYENNLNEIQKTDLTFNKILNQVDWAGRNTWFNIFMTNDLIIMGLLLDYHETDLRWLLVQRHRYQLFLEKQGLPSAKTLFFYTNEKKEMPSGKKIFFRSLGVDCIQRNYDEIYTFSSFFDN